MLGVIDYKVVNVGSILNILKKVGTRNVMVVTRPEDLKLVTKILLPGIGAFDRGVKNLKDSGLWTPLKERIVEHNIPCMGICLGMQLLTNGSEEGNLEGLSLVNAEVKKFQSQSLRVPHMGWNKVKIVNNSPLIENLPDPSRFYFVHSYYVKCNEPEDVILSTEYGQSFVSAFQRNNLYGVQFHPEKSHKFGEKIFENFARLS